MEPAAAAPIVQNATEVAPDIVHNMPFHADSNLIDLTDLTMSSNASTANSGSPFSYHIPMFGSSIRRLVSADEYHAFMAGFAQANQISHANHIAETPIIPQPHQAAFFVAQSLANSVPYPTYTTIRDMSPSEISPMSGEVEKRKAAEPDSPLAPTQLATPSPSQPAPKRARFRDPLTESDTPIGIDPTFPAKSDEAIDLTMRNTDFSTGTATDMSGGFSITSSAFNHLDSVSSRREIANFLNKNADAIVENRDPNSRFFAFMNQNSPPSALLQTSTRPLVKSTDNSQLQLPQSGIHILSDSPVRPT